MILRTIATVILWGLLGIIVYGLKEPGAMWILNLCATLTLFEVYTILGRIGFAANRITGLVTGACMIPIAFYFPGEGMAFVGDTLFALGCGRLFEGSAPQMWSSLEKLLALPDDTQIFCAHEYTQANAAFALSVEPDNPALVSRVAQIEALRARGVPTVPTTMALERATNPFLRVDSLSLQKNLNLVGADPVAVFAETRKRKDHF